MDIPRDSSTERTLITAQLRPDGGVWRAVVERGGQRLELGDVRDLIRYLERLALEPAPRVRGLK